MQMLPISSPPLDLHDVVESLDSIVAAVSGSANALDEAHGNEELLRAVRLHLKRQVAQLHDVARRVELQTRSPTQHRKCAPHPPSVPSGGTEMSAARVTYDCDGFVTGEDFDGYVAAFEAGC